MDSNSQKTLRRIEQNDDQLTTLRIGYSNLDGRFKSSDASDYSRLGAAIGNNTHLKTLVVNPAQTTAVNIANNEFLDGLKRNSSIKLLALNCNQQNLVGGVGHELLKSYQKINNNLTCLGINQVLNNGGCNVIIETLRWCRNLKNISLGRNNITDEQLLPILESIKGGCDTSLEEIYLIGNRIGNAGCHALATLLEDPNSNIQTLCLDENQIGKEGATAIANSLANNTKLKKLYLRSNPFDPSVVGSFCRVLCDTASVSDTYHSNHTVEDLKVALSHQQHAEENLVALLETNEEKNKSHVAIKKILKYHPNIDMEPLFEWGVEEDGEQNLKALPYVVDWFERAKETVAGDGDREDYHVEERQLSAIFQFAKAIPLLLEPISRIKVDDHRKHKRKRDEIQKCMQNHKEATCVE